MKQENRPDILDPDYLAKADPETLILFGVEKLKLDYEETIAKQAEQINQLSEEIKQMKKTIKTLKANQFEVLHID